MIEPSKTLLFLYHAPSPNLVRLRQAAEAGAKAVLETGSVSVQCVHVQAATARHVVQSDAVLFGTCENLATMAGLSKDFFDRCYNDLLDIKQGMPIAAYIRAGQDGTGTKRQLQSFASGLKWRWISPPLVLKGQWHDDFADQVEDLAGGLAAGLEAGIF